MGVDREGLNALTSFANFQPETSLRCYLDAWGKTPFVCMPTGAKNKNRYTEERLRL